MSSAEPRVRHSEEDAANVHESQADGQPYSEENLSSENPSAVEDDAADEIAIDGRISGVPPNYDREEPTDVEEPDNPAIDAEVQSHGRDGGA